ncbi:MAG: Crp/Fnr family transcriptional regulator [Bryobacteraceae bacterium]
MLTPCVEPVFTPCCEHFPALARIPLFHGLDPDYVVDEVSRRLVKRRFPAGSHLFAEGDRASNLFLLLSGTVKISRTSGCGREVMLSLVQAPSSLEETALFEGSVYPSTAVAVEDCVAGIVSARDFQSLCRRNPSIAMMALRLAGGRVRQLMDTIERIRFASLRQRLAAELLEIPEGIGPVAVTHQELASRLGTAREVVSRALGRLRDRGIVEATGRRIGIVDREALQREAAGA